MVQSTHEVLVGERKVVKRYRSWQRGEPEREWAGLTLLHRWCPGLAPEPLEQRQDDGVPAIVMSRVPGEPLGSSPLTPAEVTAVGEAMRRLYHAVPTGELDGLPRRRSGLTELAPELCSWIGRPHEPVTAIVGRALKEAGRWLQGPEISSLTRPSAERVFTQADGNLGNFLWDGRRCSVVDFEDCGVSDVAYEVADLVEHVSVWLPGLLDPDALVRVMELTSEQRRRLIGCRRLMALFWLLMLLPGNAGHQRNPEGSVERQADRVLTLLASGA